ncbi:rho GTPase-activating protein 20-like [Gouania willdenowi]|uniref:rho GTPase-activating protein 20-like n=1 Tax=Gouania willdenowi TaxID=441366 RepID=UPI00105593BD|nr:rho GTPase-activating protein 20-like [Gouania willdenowi]
MEDTSPQQQGEQEEEDNLRSVGRQQDNRQPMTSQSCRRQSAPSLVLTKALTRSKTLSRESFSGSVCPESCSLVTSYLSGSTRSFLLHGHTQLKTGIQTQDRHLFLFSDLLLVAKAKSTNHFKLKTRVRVCELWTASCVDEVCEGSIHQERSFVVGWPTWNCVATFSSTELKERWLHVLKSQIKEEKEREEPKTIPLRVHGKGINTYVATKTLPVSNSDSTNEVIRLALQQFGIIGNVKDFQLWVTSRRDNTPYPLIGHEFPFSIHMSHVRQNGKRGAEPSTKHCHFILRPRASDATQQAPLSGASQKSLKRRRSLITWAFWRGSAPLISDQSPSAGGGGALFGRPLQSVCVDGVLPPPVTDMLAFLYHEGLWTRGIFRRPAGARAVRDLREALDAGHARLPLSRDHVFTVAGVFKDFLRSIPGSLLCCNLHEEWLDVLDEEDEEDEQVEAVQRMILMLPKEHVVLLRPLLAVLYTIHSNAEHNHMTSFNLSVCIAPSLLWAPGAPASPEVEGHGTMKVCELIRFMTDHCEQILGVEPASLFGGGAPHRLSEDLPSESWSYPLTDSSYDSLEKELDALSGGGSPSLCGAQWRMGGAKGSLDSILMLSDGEQSEWRPGSAPSPPERDASPALESLSLEGGRCQRRRRSEPAIAYVARLEAHTPSSEDEKKGPHPLTTPTLDPVDPPWTCRSEPPPRDTPPPWGTLKVCRSLHPNTWMKNRRLSLTQQENQGAGSLHVKPEKGGGAKPASRSKEVKDSELQSRRSLGGGLHFSKPSCLRSSDSSPPVTLLKVHAHQEPSAMPFSLFKRHKSHSVGDGPSHVHLGRRRGSEPGFRVLERSCTRARLPSDPGLEVTPVGVAKEEDEEEEPLSYFSESSQQAALSLMDAHRAWLKREGAEFEQLLFAEESYV